MGRRTASVFPLPVGAISKTFFPESKVGIAVVCGSVGSVNPSSARVLRTGLASNSKTLASDSSSSMIIYAKNLVFNVRFILCFQASTRWGTVMRFFLQPSL